MKKFTSLLVLAFLALSINGLSQIFITELADPNDNTSCRYVEIFNAGASSVDLSTGYAIQRYTNGNASPQGAISLTGTISANGFYIVAVSSASFTSCYGFAPDQEIGTSGPADSNGDDQIQILDPSSTVLDIFGVPGEDGTGTCHEFEDGRAERIASVTTGNAGTWNEANWNVWGDSPISGCTNHITQAVNVGDGIFDPGEWIGYVPTSTILNFADISSTIAEDGISIDVCVEITNPDGSNATTVEIDLDGASTAINGTDFSTITFPYTLTFPAGSSASQCLTFTITDDGDTELDETIVLNLQNPAGGNSAELGTITQHTLTIDDNDIICPSVGDLIFSEIMQNPNAVSDANGEWFEVYNTTASPIDLYAMEIIDDDHPTEGFAIATSLIIPANGYLVFATNANTATNGGLTPDYAYDYANLTLGNGLDGLTIQCSGTILDIVVWDGGPVFPDPSGASMSLKVAFLNATDNDNGANWETAVYSYGDGDLGTPGCSNDAACCDLTIGTITAVCDSYGPFDDHYTVTIPFTNGGTSTYAISTTAGTIGGDDPSSLTVGDIVITDAIEGTDITVTIDNSSIGGSCNFVLDVTSPVCVPISSAVEGDIIITEILQNPLFPINDSDGEFFEVYNTTASDIDIQAWVIKDNGTNYHVINTSLVVPANDFIVLGTNADMGTNGGISVDYDYADDIALANSSDALILESNAPVEIDRVEWDNGATFPDSNGASMNLDPTKFNYLDNNNGGNWCESTTVMGTQFGTPGAANTSCIICDLVLGTIDAVCDNITNNVDTYTASIDFTGGGTSTYTITSTAGTVSGDDPTSMAAGTITITNVDEGTNITVTIDNLGVGGICDYTLNIEGPVCIPTTCAGVGSVIFSEIMQNPSAVADADGEWFELYNTTASPIDLQGWTIVDDDHTLSQEGFIIPNSLVIGGNSYLVFATNGDMMTNGGLTPDYVYDYATLTLGNGTDGLTINCSETLIDIVVWDNGATFPDPSGASMSLNVAHLNDTDNDVGANWETAVFIFGDGDFGTPGCANDASCFDQLDLTVMLEGAYGPVEMTTDLNVAGLIPGAQPYSGSPWNYTGSESFTTIPNADVVDWVLVELRDAVDAASANSSTIVETMAGLLLKDGSIVFKDGSNKLIFSSSITNNLYVVIYHRNHIGIMSSVALTDVGGIYTYDFTSSATAAYGTNAQKSLGSIWAMFGGDSDADGTVGNLDIDTNWSSETGNAGYLSSDLNLDGQSDNKDKNDIWVSNDGIFIQIP
jgi:hypothetical protein